MLGGPLCELEPARGQIQCWSNLIQNHSVVALASHPNGMVVGGTTVNGGGGSHPTEAVPKIFAWSPESRKLLFAIELGFNCSCDGIDAVAVGKTGHVVGIAGLTAFVVDLDRQKIVATAAISSAKIGAVVYNSLRAGPSGTLYGLGANGIFTFDDDNNRIQLVAPFQSISGGMAIRGQEIFFTAGPDVVSYKLPVPAASSASEAADGRIAVE